MVEGASKERRKDAERGDAIYGGIKPSIPARTGGCHFHKKAPLPIWEGAGGKVQWIWQLRQLHFQFFADSRRGTAGLHSACHFGLAQFLFLHFFGNLIGDDALDDEDICRIKFLFFQEIIKVASEMFFVHSKFFSLSFLLFRFCKGIINSMKHVETHLMLGDCHYELSQSYLGISVSVILESRFAIFCN